MEETCLTFQSKASRNFFEMILKIFIVMSTLFYRATPQGMAPENAVMWGYSLQENFVRFGIMTVWVASTFINPVRRIDVKSVGVFLLFIIGSSLFGAFGSEVRSGILNVFLATLFFKVVAEHVDIENISQYAKWIFWMVIANTVMVYLQIFGHDPLFSHIHQGYANYLESIVGFVRMKANLGVLGAICAPFLALLSPLLMIAVIPILWHGLSSAAIGSYIVSAMFILYFRLKRWVWTLVLVLMVLAGGVYVIKKDMPSGQFMERLPIWEVTISEAMKLSPYCGFGIGSFAKFAPTERQPTVAEKKTWIWAHNEFVQLFFELGLAGLAILLYFIRIKFTEFIRFKHDRQVQVLFACFLSIIMISMFHFPFHVGKFSALCVFLMALYQAKMTELQKNEKISVINCRPNSCA